MIPERPFVIIVVVLLKQRIWCFELHIETWRLRLLSLIFYVMCLCRSVFKLRNAILFLRIVRNTSQYILLFTYMQSSWRKTQIPCGGDHICGRVMIVDEKLPHPVLSHGHMLASRRTTNLSAKSTCLNSSRYDSFMIMFVRLSSAFYVHFHQGGK